MRGLAAAIVALGIGTWAGCAQIGSGSPQEELAGGADAAPADDPGEDDSEALERECEGLCACPPGEACEFECEPVEGECFLECPSQQCSMTCPAGAECAAACGGAVCSGSDDERPMRAMCTPGGCKTNPGPPE